MATSVSVAPQEAPPSKSFAERFLGVFYSPGSTFADIARRPDFIAPLIVAIVSYIAVSETMLAKIGMERIVRMSIERSGRASRMSPEQIDQAVSQGAKFGAIFTHLGGFVGPPIFLLIVAGIGLLIMNAILGQRLSFKTAFAVACYANLVGVLGALMAVAMILLGDAENFNPQNLMPSNPGFFLNPLETSKPLFALAGSLDVFSFWLMGLLGVGFSQASGGKVKALTIFLVYFGIWMLYVLCKVGWAMVS